MTLREKQSLFILNIGKLIIWAYENGYELTEGEGLRTEAQQLLYFEGYDIKKVGSKLMFFSVGRKSKTMKSNHLLKLAHDFNLFINGEYKKDVESYRPLGNYWKSLHEDNVWGGDWGWDAPHFEMKP